MFKRGSTTNGTMEHVPSQSPSAFEIISMPYRRHGTGGLETKPVGLEIISGRTAVCPTSSSPGAGSALLPTQTFALTSKFTITNMERCQANRLPSSRTALVKNGRFVLSDVLIRGDAFIEPWMNIEDVWAEVLYVARVAFEEMRLAGQIKGQLLRAAVFLAWGMLFDGC